MRGSPMKRFAAVCATAALAALIAAPTGHAFGLENLGLTITDSEGQPALQAGSHPFAVTTTLDPETEFDPELGTIPAGQLRNLSGELPPGLTGSPFATPQCASVDFVTVVAPNGIKAPNCPNSSVLGHVRVGLSLSDGSPVIFDTAVYNLVPSPGVAAKFGFRLYESGPVTIDVGVKDTPPYNVTFSLANVTQTVRVLSSSTRSANTRRSRSSRPRRPRACRRATSSSRANGLTR